ncbi:hypothetical protein [Lactobacillus acetotolerans]|uniref:hypothetical protein n=1 Tax=Lactobacillus acetotolerans TaxID=1600 RepID=UPI002FD92F1C
MVKNLKQLLYNNLPTLIFLCGLAFVIVAFWAWFGYEAGFLALGVACLISSLLIDRATGGGEN